MCRKRVAQCPQSQAEIRLIEHIFTVSSLSTLELVGVPVPLLCDGSALRDRAAEL